jgi:AcrR family transcriptional regulator
MALHIEEAALTLFDAHGPKSVTIPDICREASISHTTFFRYFKGREEIIAAGPTRYFDAVSQALLAQPPEKGVVGALCEAIRLAGPRTPQEIRLRALWERVFTNAPESEQAGIGHPFVRSRLKSAIAERCRDLGREDDIAGPLSAVTAEILMSVYAESHGVSKSAELADRLPDILSRLARFILAD